MPENMREPYEPTWKERENALKAHEWAKFGLISPQNMPLAHAMIELAHFANEMAKIYFPITRKF